MCVFVKMWFILKRERESAAQLSIDSLQPQELWYSRLLYPWNSPGKNTGAGSHSRLQGLLPSQGSNSDLPHCRQIVSCLNHLLNYSLPIFPSMGLSLALMWYTPAGCVCVCVCVCVCKCVFSFLLQHPGPWFYQMHFCFIILLTFSGAPFINGLSENNYNI